MPDNSICYYFDSSALLKITLLMNYQLEQDVTIIKQMIEQNVGKLLISRLTKIECYDKLTKSFRSKMFGQKTLQNRRNYHKTLTHLQQKLLSFNELIICDTILENAEKIILDQATQNAIGGNDAIHLALVLVQQPQMTMVTFDRAMKNVCNNLSIPVCFPVE